jgi:RHS repeat-associated protein
MDHLGSVAVITDESGTVLERLSFDAWGKRRYSNGADDPAGAITSQTDRGFTGHEELDSVALVHMNGRVYDPLLARFASADPMTENPFSTQGWNRYSYVGNSPVNFTDPSGYCFMGCFWKPIFRAVGNFIRQNWGAILQFAVSAACTATAVCAPFLPIVAGLTSAFVTGVTSGKLGLALRAGLITAVTVGIIQNALQFAGDLGGGLATATEGSPVAPVTSDPTSWGPRMGLGGSGLAEQGPWEIDICVNFPGGACPSPVQVTNGPPVSTALVGAPSAWSYVSAAGQTGLRMMLTAAAGAGAFVAGMLALPSRVGIDPDEIVHRGRIQVQNGKLGSPGDLDESWPWARTARQGPPTAEEALRELNALRDGLTRSQLRALEQAFDKAERFIDRAARIGGVDAVVRNSYQNYPPVGNYRVDIEVWAGRAFIPPGAQ